MTDFFTRLRERKLVQWALAYVAAAFALLQGIDVVAQQFGWPEGVRRGITLALVLGFFVTLVLAWYHGERGVQRSTGTELLIIALVLAFGGGFLWHLAQVPRAAPATTAVAVAAPRTMPRPAVAATAIPAKSIAVLPFENLSTDKGNAYFADGMQDLILTKLADIGDLKVISRTSTMQYGSHPQNLKTIAQQLGVATILEGSVQRAGNQVLINVQLIDANTDSHIWAQSYTRTLDNIFGVEGEVAQKVADALKAKLTPAETERVAQIPTTNTAAYNAFLQGEYYLSHGFIPDSDKTAASWYRRAVAQDPQFVLAWARLAHVLSGIALDSGSPADAAQAKSALHHALDLAPNSPDVRMAQGWYLDYVKKDTDGAMAAFSAIAKSQPNNAQALFAVGVMHVHNGQMKEALGFLQKALVLAPNDKNFLGELVNAYQALHRYPDAVRIAQRLVAADPSDGSGISILMHSYRLMGDIHRASATYDKASADVRANPYLTYGYANLQVLHRDYPAARKLFAGLRPVEGLSASTLEKLRGDVERLSGDTALAREHYLRAEGLLEAELKQNPNSPGTYSALASVFAQLGQHKQALAEAALSIRKNNAQKQFNPFRAECVGRRRMAKLQAAFGNAGAAVESLDWLLARPTGDLISVPMLKLDPTWDPIRHDPRFQALLKKYAHVKPAVAVNAASSGSAGFVSIE